MPVVPAPRMPARKCGKSALSRRAFLTAAGVGLSGAALGAPLAANASSHGATGAADRTVSAAPAALAAALPASAGIGISGNSGLLWESAASQEQSFVFMKAIGVVRLRIDIPWRWIEQTRGTYTWTLVDRIVDLARSHGMSVLGVFTTSPQWAALGGSSNQQTRPADPGVWASFIQVAVQRYRGRISAYELWNEPNGRDYFAPGPDPVAYAAMTRAAVPAIRSADPSATIIAGALGPAPDGDGLMSPVRFFGQMLDAGVGAVDAYSFHPYDVQSMSDAARWDNTAIRQVMDMHALLRARGQGDKKIWATEYGADSRRGTDAQNELIVSGMTQWAESAITGPLFIHHHRDQNAGDGYGLADANLAPKPAAYSVQWLGANGLPLRPEAQLFSQNADPALGRPVGPVFALADGYGQDHESGVRFGTAAGWFSSPTSVGDVLRRSNRVPVGPFSGGTQDVLIPGFGPGVARIFVSAAGTYLVVGGILSAWTADLGFPSSAERQEGGRVVQDFAAGRITWSSTEGIQVIR